MSAPLRKPPAPAQSPLRALTLFETLPPGHKTFLVDDGSSAPHLKPGEFAVIDTTDTELQKGEIYVIQYESGERARHIVQIRIGMIGTIKGGWQTIWWVSDLAGLRQVKTIDDPMLGPRVRWAQRRPLQRPAPKKEAVGSCRRLCLSASIDQIEMFAVALFGHWRHSRLKIRRGSGKFVHLELDFRSWS